jgi:hypothetical protein
MSFAPRPEYGLVKPLIVRTEHTIVARGGGDVLCLSLAPHLSVSIEYAIASSRFRLREGESWIAHATATNVGEGKVGIMFGVGGEHDLTERELPHLRGYRESTPVRIGNGAWTQDQLDVYGHVLDAARRFKTYLSEMEEPTKQFLIACADAAAARWSEADSGIWEIRDELRHYVYSKLMCWTALDAARESCVAADLHPPVRERAPSGPGLREQAAFLYHPAESAARSHLRWQPTTWCGSDGPRLATGQVCPRVREWPRKSRKSRQK